MYNSDITQSCSFFLNTNMKDKHLANEIRKKKKRCTTMTDSNQISKAGSSTKTNPQVNFSDCRSLIVRNHFTSHLNLLLTRRMWPVNFLCDGYARLSSLIPAKWISQRSSFIMHFSNSMLQNNGLSYCKSQEETAEANPL